MTKIDVSRLVCYGCCHSIGNMHYPGGPSGERPCMFCVRNAGWEIAQERFKERTGHRLEVWYDGSPAVKIPMDCYHSLDMLDQFSAWGEKNKQFIEQLKALLKAHEEG